jgi:hypothetical protein
MSETYVFGEVEVRKTGREATKPLPGGKLALVVEITPVNPDIDGSWKKWVNPLSLFVISLPDDK